MLAELKPLTTDSRAQEVFAQQPSQPVAFQPIMPLVDFASDTSDSSESHEKTVSSDTPAEIAISKKRKLEMVTQSVKSKSLNNSTAE